MSADQDEELRLAIIEAFPTVESAKFTVGVLHRLGRRRRILELIRRSLIMASVVTMALILGPEIWRAYRPMILSTDYVVLIMGIMAVLFCAAAAPAAGKR